MHETQMSAEPTDTRKPLPAEFPLFTLGVFLASTKHRTARDRYRLIALVLVHFLQDHDLTTRTIVAPEEAITDGFTIRAADLTQEGMNFYGVAEQKWLAAIDRGKSPTDTTILVKELRKLRA